MNWYVLQVMTGREREVCEALRRKGVKARAPAQRMEIRRRGQCTKRAMKIVIRAFGCNS